MKRLLFLIALAESAILSFAEENVPVAVGDTIPYCYMGDTLWYQVYANNVKIVTPTQFKYGMDGAANYYGTHTQPEGIVHIPDSVPVNGTMLPVTYMYEGIFYGLQNIDEVYVNNLLPSAYYCFEKSSIKKVHLSAAFFSFGNGSFIDCTQLDSVILTNPDHFIQNFFNTWSNSKPFNALGNNEFLRLGNGVYAYKGFPADSTLVIPDGVKYLASYLTYGIGQTPGAKLHAISLPASTTKLCGLAFEYCKGVISIICHATVPPSVESNSFTTSPSTVTTYYANLCTQATLYVPWSADHSVLAAYQAAEGWQDFANIVELEPEPEPEPACENYSWTATSAISGNNSQTLGDYTWTMAYANPNSYFGWSSGGYGAQLGSSTYPVDTITFTTSDPANCLIGSVTVNAAMASKGDAVLSVFIGGTQIGSSQGLTTSSADYVFTNSAKLKGDLTVRLTNTVKAIYLKSINVSMGDSTPTAVEEAAASESDAVKIFRDGRILILRNGETYDLLGHRIK